MAQNMLNAKLIACGQITEIESIYTWENKLTQAKEFLLTMKTRTQLYDKCELFIKQNHPYKTPQIVATPITHGSAEYFNWIDESLSS